MSEAVNPEIVEFLGRRGISAETAFRMNVYSAARGRSGGEPEPSATGRIIAFPYIDRGRTVAEKYRTADKRMWQKKGGKRVFYNVDILDDPKLSSGEEALVIVEGEIDCLSVIEAGHPWCVSVPDGAPPARDQDGNLIEVPETAADIDPRNDDKFQFVFNAWERLKGVKRIILATDNDEPGQRLAEELVRRLGRVRCSFVTMLDGCKDFNDVLLKHGAPGIHHCLQQARPYPMSGIYSAADFPEEPPLRPVTTGFPALGDNLLVYYPSLMVVTGFAMAGKSSWAMQLVAQLAKLHGWKAAIASFEMRVKPFLVDNLSRGYAGWRYRENEMSRKWVDQNFQFISPDPDKDEECDLEWILARAEVAVVRHGIRVLLIDPWNEIDHGRRRDETTTEYTGRALRRIKYFARQFEVLVIIVAHPSKGAINKDPEDLSLYDIADTAHFANKADQGVIIMRQPDTEFSTVKISKVRYQPDTGTAPVMASMYFNKQSRLFEDIPGGIAQ
jgi:twinkle protein